MSLHLSSPFCFGSGISEVHFHKDQKLSLALAQEKKKKKYSVTMSSETAPPLIAAQLNHMLLNFPHLSKVMRFNPIFATKLRAYWLIFSLVVVI